MVQLWNSAFEKLEFPERRKLRNLVQTMEMQPLLSQYPNHLPESLKLWSLNELNTLQKVEVIFGHRTPQCCPYVLLLSMKADRAKGVKIMYVWYPMLAIAEG